MHDLNILSTITSVGLHTHIFIEDKTEIKHDSDFSVR